MRLAQDGLPARVSGSWTQDKLGYVERYASAFMRAMAPKREEGKWDQLIYIDPLAGPGMGVDRETGAEFEGSPLRALRVQPAFDHLFFGDLNAKYVEALKRRIAPSDLPRVTVRVGDCHAVTREAVGRLSRKALGLAFVDPQGFEVTLKLFETLATRPIDILFLFPGGIGVKRNLAKFARKRGGPLDALMGGDQWRALLHVKLVAGDPLSADDLASRDQPIIMQCRQKMAALGFLYSDQGEPYFTNEKNVKMYHLLFFSQHRAGLSIWRGIKRIEPSGQRTLPLD